MENQWGDLSSYRGISTSARGDFVIPGIQCGNVWIGVQPLLGVEGDPMRLLFERDLTPHPQVCPACSCLPMLYPRPLPAFPLQQWIYTCSTCFATYGYVCFHIALRKAAALSLALVIPQQRRICCP